MKHTFYPFFITTFKGSFGMLMPQRSYNTSEYRYGFNGQEKDDEVYGSGQLNTAEFWQYDTRLGRRWNLDPKPVVGLSQYSAFANNPNLYTDTEGDSAVVLNAPTGASGAGHMAILIQDGESKWRLYSKNGTHGLGGAYGETPRGVEHKIDDKAPQEGKDGAFKTVGDFMNSNLNPIINKETGERYYSEGYLIPMTRAQDKLAVEGAKEQLDKKNYNVLGSNCACMVQSALSKAGKEDGSPSIWRRMIAFRISPILAVIDDKTPKLIYRRIKAQNPGGYIYYPNGVGKQPAKK